LATTEQYLELAEYIQAQLQELGIDLRIEVIKASVLSEAISNGKIPVFRKSWLADYPDEENFLALFYGPNKSPFGFNYTHFFSTQFNILYEQAQIEKNEYQRRLLYQQMDNIILENAAIVPLYYDEVVRITHKNIIGLGTNSMNMLNLKRVKKLNG
jgi:peptide/nickel transport system substrate-binding protein